MEPLRRARDKLRGDRGDHDDHDDSGHDSGHDDDVADGLAANAAFNTKALPGKGDGEGPSKMQRVKEKAKTIAHATAHPRQAAQSKATKQVIVNERPWLEHQAVADEKLLDAHDTLDRARADDERPAGELPREPVGVDEAKERVQDMEGQREEQQAAWHMSRYVKRARVVRYPIHMPPRSHYHEYGSNGEYRHFKWIKWVGHLVLYGLQDTSLHYIEPTNAVGYDREVLTRHVERLLVASESFQFWWMRVRRVYTWEDPWLTTKWLLFFLFCVKTGYFMTWFWLYLLYSVATNFYGKHGRTWMRESYHRANRTDERAAMLSELIVRHGSDAWVGPFLEEFGPWMQLQIGDLADFLEICVSYYNWKNRSATTAACVMYAALFLISAVPSVEYSMKVMWMACGVWFFLSRPIATNYPRFRHVVDPVRWMYWNIPTDSEAAFDYLRKQALSSLEPRYEPVPYGNNDSFEDADDDDVFFDSISTSHAAPLSSRRPDDEQRAAQQQPLMSFTARWSGRRGRLHITRSSVRFVADVHRTSSVIRSHNPKAQQSAEWERSFTDLLEVRKASSPPSKLPVPFTSKGAGGAALSILWAPGAKADALLTTEEIPNDEAHCEEELLYGMEGDRRDEAFNAVIGLSGVLWMGLQPEAGWQDGAALQRIVDGGS
ncbi:hypothetical protein LTR36_003256 [Oleoguttula mirabilis]|uniref:Uncharacterized protein n=1 Tax=Oleoguttula mirabilis TaxID=1507867 RepID=A0AAV9JXA7_9PEZI|nr:hypothetical protein LTR36_003256 [Oleoguttula mirabilis]